MVNDNNTSVIFNPNSMSTHPDVAAMTAPRRPGIYRVALCDADPVSRLVSEHIITARGHDLVVLASSDQLAGLIERGAIDVLVTDGRSVCLNEVAALRALNGPPAIVVISNELEKPAATGICDVVLSTPVGSRELLAAIDIAGRNERGVVVHR